MDWSALVLKCYRNRIAVLSFVALITIAAITLGWPLFSNFEAHRAGYISGVLSWGKSCGAKISPSARERLKYYQQQGNVTSFTPGFALGRKQLLEQMRDAAGYANTCRRFVDRYARASETAMLIAFPSDLSEFEWPFWLIVLLTAWLLLRSLVSTLRQPGILPSLSTMKNWLRVLSLLCLTVSAACVVAVALQFPPDELGHYWGYYWTNTRGQTLLAVLTGFAPLVTCIALFGLSRWIIHGFSRWIIRRKARRKWKGNRIEPPIRKIRAQSSRDDAMGAAPAAHRLRRPEIAASEITSPYFGHVNQRLTATTAKKTGKAEHTIQRAAKRGKKPAHWRQVLRMVDQRERQEHAEVAKHLRAAAHSELDPARHAELNHFAQINERFAERGAPSPDEVANSPARRVRPWLAALGRVRQ
jgi:hypothetical protein